MAGQHALAVDGLGHADAAQAVQALGVAGGEARRHVLGDHDRGEVGRQAGQHLAGGLGAAGGGAEEDDLLGRQPAHRPRGGGLGRGGRRGRGGQGQRGLADLGAGGGADLLGDVGAQLAQAVGHADLGLGDKVDRAQLQGAQGGLGPALGEGGDHDDGHGPQPHQAGQEVQAVHLGHLDIEGDDVGGEAADHLARGQRVGGGADAAHVGLAVDDLGEQAADQGGVVDDDDADGVHAGSPRPRAQKRSMEPAALAAGTGALAAARSWASRSGAAVAARRLTMARPLAGKKATLRG